MLVLILLKKKQIVRLGFDFDPCLHVGLGGHFVVIDHMIVNNVNSLFGHNQFHVIKLHVSHYINLVADTATYTHACKNGVLFASFLWLYNNYGITKIRILIQSRPLGFNLVGVLFLFLMLELMLLGLISLLLAQWARWISEICVNSSLFSSKFYVCSEKEYGISKTVLFESSSSFSNESLIPPKGLVTQTLHQCGEVICLTWSFLLIVLIVCKKSLKISMEIC